MKSAPKLYTFVLMPFLEQYKDVYELGIKAACEEVGVYCERVDETHVLGTIYDKIVNSISKADIIISDLTGINPNVYYETGYAHAIKKVVIHLCQDIGEIPFDLLGFQHVVYSPVRIVELKEKLKEKLEWASEYVQTKGGEIGTLSFDFYYNGEKIKEDIVTDIETIYRNDGSVGQMRTTFRLDILNIGSTESQTLGPVYIYTGPEIVSVSSEELDFHFTDMPIPSPSEYPEFRYRHSVEFRDNLVAAEWKALTLTVYFKEGMDIGDRQGIEIPIRIRFLTESIPLDFDLKLNASHLIKRPPLEIIIDGEAFPETVSAKVVMEYSRDGSIEEAGFQITTAFRNTSSRKQKVGPIQLFTNNLVRKFDTLGIGLIMGIGTDLHERSNLEGFSRKFTMSETTELDSFASESGQLSFDLEPRNLERKLEGVTIPLLLKIFTQSGPIDYRFKVILEE